MRSVLALAALILAACSGPASEARSVCTVAAQPEAFAGERVLVHGTVLQTKHGALLIDSQCPDAAVALGSENTDDPNSKAFDDLYWKNYLPTGQVIVASVEGFFVYNPASSARRLDDYRVTKFQLGGPKSAP